MKIKNISAKAMAVAFALVALCMNAGAQHVNSIQTIFSIMEESKVRYSIKLKEEYTPAPDRSEKRLTNEVYQAMTDQGKVIREYQFSEDVQSVLDEAEEAFSIMDMKEARKLYLKVLMMDPTAYKVIVYVGDTYFHEGNITEARKYYEEAVEKNYIDYLAHMSLADALLRLGDKKGALKEATITKILNRNNTNVQQLLERVYASNKLTYNDWYFNPQYALSQSYDEEAQKEVVTIEFADVWATYALNKAVWQYEPGYADNYAKTEAQKIYNQERECVVNLLESNYKQKSSKKILELKVLSAAFEKGHLDDYVMYEAVLPDYPGMVYYLNPENIEGIADYILNVRCKFKK